MNIIIKTPSFIGDTVMMMPALELLFQEYPQASFTVVCKNSSKDLFRGKNISKIIIDDTKNTKKGRLKRTFKLISIIKEERYDLGVLFHNTFLDALVFKLSNIDTIIGYDKENRKVLLDFYLKIDRTRHYVNHYCNLVNQYLNNKYTDIPKMLLYSKKSKLLDNKNHLPYIGFVLGGENKDTRRYPKELSLELFKILKDEKINIVLLGDKDDSYNNDEYEKYLKEQNCNVINYSGKTTVAEYIDIISELDLLVTIDTSAVHISAAVDTKFILLVGKGSSAIDTTYPKVDFGEMIFKGYNKIKDEDLIYQIKPLDIKKSIMDKI